MGDFTSAVVPFEIASGMRSTLLGDHQNTAESYHLLGVGKCVMVDYKGALESVQKALQLGRKLSTGDQRGIAEIPSNIGEVYHKMGDCHTAREQFQFYFQFKDHRALVKSEKLMSIKCGAVNPNELKSRDYETITCECDL